MTKYVLASAADPAITQALARRLVQRGIDAIGLDAGDRNSFMDIGRQYGGQLIHVVYGPSPIGPVIVNDLQENTKSVEGVSPRVEFVHPSDALRRFRKEKPAVVVVQYGLDRIIGIKGTDLISQMYDIETGSRK